jgi:hypothetical protein
MITDMLYSINPNDMILGLLFIIFFVFINFALTRIVFKKEKTSASIIALCVSLLAVYGINRTNFDVTGIVYSIGITEEMIYTIVPFIILAGLIFLIWKVKLCRTLIIAGIALIVASFFVYEQTWVLIAGIILLILGLILCLRRKNKQNPSDPKNKGGDDDEVRKQRTARLRSQAELQRKYNEYSNAIKIIQKRNNGKIPAMGTSEGNLRHRYIQAMQAIESLARQQGFRLS